MPGAFNCKKLGLMVRETVFPATKNRVLRCGILCSPVFSLCFSPSISPPVSLPRYGMVGTMAGDSAPRSLSDFRSSGVCCSFSDSSLVGLRPFSLPLFTLPALSAWFSCLFVVICGTWLGFYLKCNLWPQFHFCWFTGYFNPPRTVDMRALGVAN